MRRALPPRTRRDVHDELAALVGGLAVVELGCGPGRLMSLLERLGARCVGLDLADLSASRVVCHRVRDAALIIALERRGEFCGPRGAAGSPCPPFRPG